MAVTIMTQNNIQAVQPKTINVLVWDERQPKQKQMYENFLGNHIADQLKKNDRFSVRSVGLDDPNQGLSSLSGGDMSDRTKSQKKLHTESSTE